MKQHKPKERMSFRLRADIAKWLAKEAEKTGLTQTKILENSLLAKMTVKS